MPFPVAEKYIEQAEAELGASFPDSFRVKMMEQNGGGVEVNSEYFELHPFYDTSDKKRIKRTCNSIVHETNTARDHYRLPGNLVIVGNNGGGDVMVFTIEPEGKMAPDVYYLDHETEEMVLLASDFSELEVVA